MELQLKVRENYRLKAGKEDELKNRAKTVGDAIKSAEERNESAGKRNEYLKAIFDALMANGSFNSDDLIHELFKQRKLCGAMDFGIFGTMVDGLESAEVIEKIASCSGGG